MQELRLLVKTLPIKANEVVKSISKIFDFAGSVGDVVGGALGGIGDTIGNVTGVLVILSGDVSEKLRLLCLAE